MGFAFRSSMRVHSFAPAQAVEGRRFVSFLFTLHPALVRELAPILRNIISYGRAAELDAVGEARGASRSRSPGLLPASCFRSPASGPLPDPSRSLPAPSGPFRPLPGTNPGLSRSAPLGPTRSH